MPIVIKKRVLTEKVSKMFDYVGIEHFLGKCIATTNEHFVTLIESERYILLNVLTYVPINLWKDEYHQKTIDFYHSSKKNNFKNYEGITYCNQNNFINSGFIKIPHTNIQRDKAWLVIDNLYDIGSIIKSYLSNYLLNDIANEKKMFKELKKQTKRISNILNKNCIIMNSIDYGFIAGD